MLCTEKKIKYLVTGGAGFIGSALVRYLINNTDNYILNIDKLTYAGNLESLIDIDQSERYYFRRADICDRLKLDSLLNEYRPDIILNLAAESHVDRSINEPSAFIETNIVGTYNLLESAYNYWRKLDMKNKKNFRFLHISTDEVYGDLGDTKALFTENSPYAPSSPYSASKASSDHLVRAWYRTYGLPTLVTNCTNNYGPYHFPEKLIPHTILNALAGNPIPIYGSGDQIRDWLYVDDHVRALVLVATKGNVGETYNIGSHCEKTNLEVVSTICEILDELRPDRPKGIAHYHDLIEFVEDRPGHDKRYALDAGKIVNTLGWKPKESFESGIRKTVRWYLDNSQWWQNILQGTYRMQRIGLKGINL